MAEHLVVSSQRLKNVAPHPYLEKQDFFWDVIEASRALDFWTLWALASVTKHCGWEAMLE